MSGRPFSEIRAKAFDFAQETTKQMIALAVGILTITATFHDDLAKAKHPPPTWSMQWAWICYAVSVCAGAWTLMALTGSLARGNGEPDIYGRNIRLPSGLQVISFAAGVVLTSIYARNALAR
jgi:hypothetical protein